MSAASTVLEPSPAADNRAPREGRLVAAGTTPLHRLDGDLRVEFVESPADLTQYAADWDDLARNAADPNVFFERWFLQPALETFTAGRRMGVALVFRGSRRQDVAPGLVGLFPFEQIGRRRFGARSLKIFGHEYGFLHTPLIRDGHTTETWNALFDWAEQESEVDLIDLPGIRGEGPVAQGLAEVLYDRRSLSLVASTTARAFLRRGSSADEVIGAALSGKQRHEYQRQFRRLADLGAVEFRELSDRSQLDDWITQFLTLEADGWKGAAQTALAKSQGGESFFRAVVGAAADAGRLQALGLWLNDRPVALKVNFLAAPGSFAFKIAYDEQFAKQSPGVQLELENIRRVHDEPSLDWMDSCAAPGHPMINRLWRGRTIIQNVLVSTGRIRGNLAVGLRPLWRAGRRIFGRSPCLSTRTPPSRVTP